MAGYFHYERKTLVIWLRLTLACSQDGIVAVTVE
jgi:hypothetical protein